MFVVASATASTKKKTASVQVCVLLPDTKSSVRWVQFDAPAMKAAFKKAGVTASINNALNDPLKQKAQAQACIAAGATVVIETALDNGSASSIEKLFTSKGGKAIDYDRQVTRRHRIGVRHLRRQGGRQGTGQRRHRRDEGARARTRAARSPSSGAARPTRTRSGSRAATTPSSTRSSRQHKLKKGPQQFVPDWDANNAATIFSQMLVKTSNKIQGVLAANDNIAGAVIADLKAKHLKPASALRVRMRRVAGCPEHHLRLADGHGLQVRACRGERCRSCCGRAHQGQEAEDERLPDERQEARSRPSRFR